MKPQVPSSRLAISPRPPTCWMSDDPYPSWLGTLCVELFNWHAPSGTEAYEGWLSAPQLPGRGHQRHSSWVRRLPALVLGSVVHAQACTHTRKEKKMGLWQEDRPNCWWAGERPGGTVGKEGGQENVAKARRERRREERGNGVGSWQGVFPVLRCFWREALVRLDVEHQAVGRLQATATVCFFCSFIHSFMH